MPVGLPSQRVGWIPFLRHRIAKVGDPWQPAAPLQGLDWSGFELHDQVAPAEMIAIGVARWGIAETGSLVFHSGADTPILANFLPLHHLVMVRADTILPFLDDYAAATAGQRPPRNVNIITGASGTTDIEGIVEVDVLDGGTLDLSGNDLGGNGSATGNLTTLTLASGTLKNVGQINNGAGLTKATANTLTLAGASSYTGVTTVSAGKLAVTSFGDGLTASALGLAACGSTATPTSPTGWTM